VSLGPERGELWHGLVAEHVLTRTVRDTAAILDSVAGPMPGDPYSAPPPARHFREEVGAPPGSLRVGLLSRAPGGSLAVHPECVRAAERTARLLEELGHRVEQSFPPALDDPRGVFAIVTLVETWTARDVDLWSERTGAAIGPEDVEPYTWTLVERGRAVSAREYIGAVQALERWAHGISSWWEEGFDLLLTPTLAELPPPLGEFVPVAGEPLRPLARGGRMVAFTAPFNATGQPAISLPLHWTSESLPVGVQLVAAYGREDLLLRVASQLEEARPWRERRPAVRA
jgi:amidase